MKCIFIIQYNKQTPQKAQSDFAPSSVLTAAQVEAKFLSRIPGAKRIEWLYSSEAGVMWIIDTEFTGGVNMTNAYMELVSHLVGFHLNGFYVDAKNNNVLKNVDHFEILDSTGATLTKGGNKVAAKLNDGKNTPFTFPNEPARWSRIPFNQLLSCFVPIGNPLRGNDNNPYAILPTDRHASVGHPNSSTPPITGLAGGEGGHDGFC